MHRTPVKRQEVGSLLRPRGLGPQSESRPHPRGGAPRGASGPSPGPGSPPCLAGSAGARGMPCGPRRAPPHPLGLGPPWFPLPSTERPRTGLLGRVAGPGATGRPSRPCGLSSLNPFSSSREGPAVTPSDPRSQSGVLLRAVCAHAHMCMCVDISVSMFLYV